MTDELKDPKAAWTPPSITPVVPDVLGAIEQLRTIRGHMGRLHHRLDQGGAEPIGFAELSSTIEHLYQGVEATMHLLEGGKP